MIGIKYAGTFTDYSGYGQANRNFITALYHAGLDITTELVVQVPERGDFGWTGDLARALENRQIDYQVKIIHLTPDMYPRYLEKSKYNIGHLFWETDRLPKEWTIACNGMDEIWTASEQQAEMIRKSGVVVPIHWFPQPIDTLSASYSPKPLVIKNFNGYIFYSIFQWIERKNPRALITSYWKAFAGKTNVALVIKTYGNNYSEQEFDRIKLEVEDWKKSHPHIMYPKLFLVKKLMTAEQMWKFHNSADCYINASRGEGWCIPAVEAMLAGNSVIGIDRTGFTDYFDDKLFYPCGTTTEDVVESTNISYYRSDQKWLNINSEDLVKQMLKVYNDRDAAAKVGKKAQEYVVDNFNYWSVGEAMKQRLEEIERKL